MVKGVKDGTQYTLGHHCTGAPTIKALGSDCGGDGKRRRTAPWTWACWEAAVGEPACHLWWTEGGASLCQGVKGKGELGDKNAVSGLLQIIQVVARVRVRGGRSLEQRLSLLSQSQNQPYSSAALGRFSHWLECCAALTWESIRSRLRPLPRFLSPPPSLVGYSSCLQTHDKIQCFPNNNLW